MNREEYNYEKERIKLISDKLLNFAIYLRQSGVDSDAILDPVNEELEYQMHRIKKDLWSRPDSTKMIW